MPDTTIKVRLNTKTNLDQFKEYKNETYDEVINKIIFIAKTSKTNPKLSKETVEMIEKARERIRKGMFWDEKEARKRLGL